MPPAPPTPPAAPARKRPRRPIAWTIALISLAVLLTTTTLLAIAIGKYQKAGGRHQYYFKDVGADFRDSGPVTFSLGGLPVNVREEVDAEGNGYLYVTYAQDELRLKVEIPNRNTLPIMLRNENWFRILSWADGTGMNIREFDAARASGERAEHYVIVTRALGPGAAAGGWGDVWRHEWTFNFHTFTPPPPGSPPGVGGGFAHEHYEYPESPRAFARRVNAAVMRGETPPERNPRELKEGTWQYGAAMLVMPSGSAPPYAFNRGVLMENRWLVLGASVSIIILMFSVALALAPPRVTESLTTEPRA